MAEENTALTRKEEAALGASERFAEMVISKFKGNVAGKLDVTDYQRKLIQGYFIIIDKALKTAEMNRVTKNEKNKDHEKYDNTLPVSWNNVDMIQLAIDLVYFARLGLDMQQDNVLFPVPYKNNKKNQYDVNLMLGYNGKKFIAEKYAMDPPVSVTIELVYSTDTFIPIKKSFRNPVESYEFEITNPFNRGNIVGGFAYIQYQEATKNELIIMSKNDIDKRKPAYASPEFWGGIKTEWIDGKKTEVQTEGWYEEMARKTIVREAYSSKHILIDTEKIDDTYRFVQMRETQYAETEAESEISREANMTPLDISGPAALPQAEEPPAISLKLDPAEDQPVTVIQSGNEEPEF